MEGPGGCGVLGYLGVDVAMDGAMGVEVSHRMKEDAKVLGALGSECGRKDRVMG